MTVFRGRLYEHIANREPLYSSGEPRVSSDFAGRCRLCRCLDHWNPVGRICADRRSRVVYASHWRLGELASARRSSDAYWTISPRFLPNLQILLGLVAGGIIKRAAKRGRYLLVPSVLGYCEHLREISAGRGGEAGGDHVKLSTELPFWQCYCSG
jgi:hypothetical protein